MVPAAGAITLHAVLIYVDSPPSPAPPAQPHRRGGGAQAHHHQQEQQQPGQAHHHRHHQQQQQQRAERWPALSWLLVAYVLCLGAMALNERWPLVRRFLRRELGLRLL